MRENVIRNLNYVTGTFTILYYFERRVLSLQILLSLSRW
jgi:hypothetical protein